MLESLRTKIADLAMGQLTDEQIDELVDFFKQALANNSGPSDDIFFKNLSSDMTGGLKELAMLIINFRRDLRSRICPEITDLAVHQIPEAADQLAGIIETTEVAANKIMDNLESMQGQTDKMGLIFESLKNGELDLSGDKACLDPQTVEAITPLIKHMESDIQKHDSLISDSFIQMSFQDLTGQRIKRIMTLVTQMEQRLKEMIISFGIQLTEHEKNPHISEEALQKTIKDKVAELAGPQREGEGLDQAGIDDLLMNL